MEDNRRSTNHFHLGDVGGAVVLALVGLAGGAVLLWRGLAAGHLGAVIITTALVVLALLALGGGAVLFVLSTASRHEEKRSLVEQARWQDNAQENLQIMGSMQKVQNAQNQMLLKQAREAQRALPAPDGDVLELGFQPVEGLFDEIELGD